MGGGEQAGAEISAIANAGDALRQELSRVIVGQEAIAGDLITALLARGHCLLIGVPGLAKTLLVRALARALEWDFKRIQFTPDLMPGDITGTEMLETDARTGDRSLRFVPGPIFANVVLADEINRTPPRTQSALLEAMQEYAVTAGGRTMAIDRPFFVVATQNPIEQEGTYPLPEAQLDRFLFSLSLDYPSREDEERIAAAPGADDLSAISPVLRRDDLLRMQGVVARMPVSPHVVTHAVSMVRASRPGEASAPAVVRQYVEWGAGPRASQHLLLAARARAALAGRAAPSVGDVQSVASQVLTHRIIPNYAAAADGISAGAIVADLVRQAREPAFV